METQLLYILYALFTDSSTSVLGARGSHVVDVFMSPSDHPNHDWWHLQVDAARRKAEPIQNPEMKTQTWSPNRNNLWIDV